MSSRRPINIRHHPLLAAAVAESLRGSAGLVLASRECRRLGLETPLVENFFKRLTTVCLGCLDRQTVKWFVEDAVSDLGVDVF